MFQRLWMYLFIKLKDIEIMKENRVNKTFSCDWGQVGPFLKKLWPHYWPPNYKKLQKLWTLLHATMEHKPSLDGPKDIWTWINDTIRDSCLGMKNEFLSDVFRLAKCQPKDSDSWQTFCGSTVTRLTERRPPLSLQLQAFSSWWFKNHRIISTCFSCCFLTFFRWRISQARESLPLLVQEKEVAKVSHAKINHSNWCTIWYNVCIFTIN